MVENHPVRFIDKIQFSAVVGPLIVLLTLTGAFLHGSRSAWYLYPITFIGMPVCWKWGVRGLAGVLAALFVFVTGYHFFGSLIDPWWQIGSGWSLALGLFTTHLGFEELKQMMTRQQLESQSRLENLLSIDEDFNRAQKKWNRQEISFKEEILAKKEAISSLRAEVEAYEKLISEVRKDFSELQKDNIRLLQDAENRGRELSAAEQKNLFIRRQSMDLEKRLEQSQSEREVRLQKEKESFRERLAEKEAVIETLRDDLLQREKTEREFSEEISRKNLSLRDLRSALEDKVSRAEALGEKVLACEAAIEHGREDRKRMSEEIETLCRDISVKEKESVSLKRQLEKTERDLVASEKLYGEKTALFREEKRRFDAALADEQKGRRVIEESLQRQLKETERLREEVKGREVEKASLKEEIRRGEALLADLREEYEKVLDNESAFKELRFRELEKLNEARSDLYQASLDRESLQKKASKAFVIKDRPLQKEHWLFRMEEILKTGVGKTKLLHQLPKDLSDEIVSFRRLKAMYKQTREQFEEKSRLLEKAREELFEKETILLEWQRKEEEKALKEPSALEKALEASVKEKEEEAGMMEEEIRLLNGMISGILR